MPRKVLSLLLLTSHALFAAQQLLFVVADTFDSSTAALQRYESDRGRYRKVGTPIAVNLGRHGMGWSTSEGIGHSAEDPVKHEGDGRAPAGIFALGKVFGYTATYDTKMPYLHAGRDLICIDDGTSPFYNRIKKIDADTTLRSFEWMRRDDDLYRIGVTIGHNNARKPGAGSCIFLHVQRAPGAPTSGCTSMKIEELRRIIRWLDPQKEPLLVQIPKAYCHLVMERFEGVECP